MASTESTAATNDSPQSNSVNENKAGDESENSSPKRAKLDEGESSASKKTRGSNKNKRSDAVMIAEAKAAFGDIDTTEGRRLRKRSTDPPKVEEKRQTPKRASRRKGSMKEVEPEDEDTSEDIQTSKKNGSKATEDEAAKTDGIEDKATVEDKKEKPAEDTNAAAGDGKQATSEDKKDEVVEDKKLENDVEKSKDGVVEKSGDEQSKTSD